MGAILRFILINAISVIGAKVIAGVTDRVSEKLFKDEAGTDHASASATSHKTPAGLALDTKYCKTCGAFVIKGESCDCASKA